MLDALISKYQGEIAIAKANIEVYLNHSVGIGEHSNIVQEVDKQISIIAENDEKIRTIEDHYPQEDDDPNQLIQAEI